MRDLTIHVDLESVKKKSYAQRMLKLWKRKRQHLRKTIRNIETYMLLLDEHTSEYMRMQALLPRKLELIDYFTEKIRLVTEWRDTHNLK